MVKCQFGQAIKSLVEEGKITSSAVIRFNINDCEVMDEKTDTPLITLNQCQVMKPEMTNTIGAPYPYSLYKEKVLII
jgi:hypothetical protein